MRKIPWNVRRLCGDVGRFQMIFQTLAEIVDKIYPKVAEIRRSQKIFIELHRTHPISKQVGENSEVLRKSFQISADVSGNWLVLCRKSRSSAISWAASNSCGELATKSCTGQSTARRTGSWRFRIRSTCGPLSVQIARNVTKNAWKTGRSADDMYTLIHCSSIAEFTERDEVMKPALLRISAKSAWPRRSTPGREIRIWRKSTQQNIGQCNRYKIIVYAFR